MLRLEIERRRKGWTQWQLSQHSGIHPSVVSHLERGTCHPWPKYRARIAEALGVPEEDLFKHESPTGGTDD